MPKARKPKAMFRHGLGFPWEKQFSEADMALRIEFFFIQNFGKYKCEDGVRGHGLPFHVKEAMKLMWPTMMWHRWADLLVDEFLESTGRLGVFGPSSSGKSFVLTRAAATLFYARPQGTTVLISSTTLKALRRRIWDYFVSSHKMAKERFPWLPGHLIESDTMLLADPSDAAARSFKSGVVGVACKSGGEWNGLQEYIGCKNDVMVIVADELQFVPMGVVDALANLESNDVCYFAGMGNLPNIHNPLAHICEPKEGWEALTPTIKTRSWKTKWHNGRAVQLIGMDSPNLDYPEGMEPFKGLIGRRYIAQCAENYGVGTTKYAMFAEGSIPGDSMSCYVFTKQQCVKNHASDQVTWSHEKTVRGYGLDAAYSGVGGDRTVGFPFIFGKDVTGRWRFWLGTMRIFGGSPDPKLTHCEYIASECKKECEERGIEPSHFFFDGTGRSELTSALGRLWSPQVVPIEFGGTASERPSFTGEKHTEKEEKKGEVKNCNEVFDRFVTELWFAVRECIMHDQMRGLPTEAIDEGSQRLWELVRGNKYSIETKGDMKERGLRSPDIMDAIVAALEGARRLGFPLGKTPVARVRQGNPWLDYQREKQWDDMKKEELAA